MSFINFDNVWVYDIETYPNVFTVCFKRGDDIRVYEISSRRSDMSRLLNFISWLKLTNASLVGFNCLAFDSPILTRVYYMQDKTNAYDLFKFAQQIIIDYKPYYTYEVLIPQIDLYLIHHFNSMNAAIATSLKKLEFNLKWYSLEDLPYEVGSYLTDDEIPKLIEYNKNDVLFTEHFYFLSTEKIKFRDELSQEVGKNWVNTSDTSLGEKFIKYRLNLFGNTGTVRELIEIKNVILPCVKFTEKPFEELLQKLNKEVVNTFYKSIKLSVVNRGFTYDIGSGGVHGCINTNETVSMFESAGEYRIIDIDVVSFYPSLAIINRFYPEHLNESFCVEYENLFNERKKYKKRSVRNKMLKLALNSVYGKSKFEKSIFYDWEYLLKTTINGQLLLCMLAEELQKLLCCKMLQINTDGLTMLVHNAQIQTFKTICDNWSINTKLQLEHNIYTKMFIRDVNNYIAVHQDGSTKRKGCYEYDKAYNQNSSMLIVSKAATEYLLHGADYKTFIYNHKDPYDFMILAKAPKSNKLIYGNQTIQKTSRFYVSKVGAILKKTAPPVSKHKKGEWKRKAGISNELYTRVRNEVKGNGLLDSTGHGWDERINTAHYSYYDDRETRYVKNALTTICNNINDFDFSNVNYDFYIAEVEKIVNIKRNTNE